MDTLIVDCDTCSARGRSCADCVMTALLGDADAPSLDAEERRVLGLFADSGLLPPLRLVQATSELAVNSEEIRQIGWG